MIVVSAMIGIAEGKGDEYAAEFARLAPLVRRDPGCLTYVLHRMIGSPDRFFVFEQYEDEAAIKYHVSTPHTGLPREDRAPREEPRRRPMAGDRLISLAAQRTSSPDGS
jgi:quinol monooxygenase YgiN